MDERFKPPSEVPRRIDRLPRPAFGPSLASNAARNADRSPVLFAGGRFRAR